MEKNHKYLQDKYFLLTLEKRMKPHRDLFDESKAMLKRKVVKEKKTLYGKRIAQVLISFIIIV